MLLKERTQALEDQRSRQNKILEEDLEQIKLALKERGRELVSQRQLRQERAEEGKGPEQSSAWKPGAPEADPAR